MWEFLLLLHKIVDCGYLLQRIGDCGKMPGVFRSTTVVHPFTIQYYAIT